MSAWTKEQLTEMFGDDVIEQLAFLSGCTKHRLSNDPVIPDGWIIPDETLRKFAELIVKECANICRDRKMAPSAFTADELLEHFGVEE